ncbi:hypothetical protein Agub_g868, partial [Astrephomene gubernaculifera]
RGRLQVVSYRSALTDLMLQRAQRYAEVTGGAANQSADEVAAALSPMIGPRGITFLADGVIYQHDRTRDVRQLANALSRQHTAYEHVVYRPVVSAVNEEQGVVFSAIYYVLRNRGSLFGRDEPTNRISKGFLVDKLSFDKEGHFVSSLVTRQLTLEERDALLPDPTAWQPAVVEEKDLIAVPDVVAGPDDYKFMSEQISKWAGVWSSEAPLDKLPELLAPNCRELDAYGFSNKPNGIVWQGVDQAREAVKRTHNQYDNRNQLVSYAVSFEHKLGFQHWRANAVPRQELQQQPAQGAAAAGQQQG